MTRQNEIRRVVDLPAPRDVVWNALTTRAGLEGWFSSRIEIDFRVGGDILFAWEHEQFRARISVIEAPHRFAYRWQPGSNEDRTAPFEALHLTVVEFLLDELPDGTRLTLVEHGFASLPEHLFSDALGDNEGGWTESLNDLSRHLETQYGG